MIKSITTIAPVKHPNTAGLTNFLNVDVTINEAQGGCRVSGSKLTVYVPWSNIAFCILDTSKEAAIVVPPEPLAVEFPPAEMAPDAPIVQLPEVAKDPAKVKKGPFGRPLKPPA